MQYTEQDLDRLIDEKLDDCSSYPEMCKLLATPTGHDRVKERIKELILQAGITDISAAIVQVETQLNFE